MLAGGAIDEVRALMERGLDPSLPAMRAIGVRDLAAHIYGEIALYEAIGFAKTASRQYAKRQYTWLRGQTPADWLRHDMELNNVEISKLAILLRDTMLTN
jgi:tRNA dimethylallyltransferase